MDRCISVLGSTGSIGRQTLDVAEQLGARICALTAGSNVDRMEEQCRAFRPKLAVMATPELAEELARRLRDLPIQIQSGTEGLLAAATLAQADTVITAVVGMVGLEPTLAAIRAGKRIGLANKETLVCAGPLVLEEAKDYGAKIYPVDSEHSAIFQCLQGNLRGELRRILLTASGGPFFGWTKEQLKEVTPAHALRHPNWSMGAKVTIDSATLMNKGLEVIEASWLFDMPPEKIDVVIHRESIVHSLIEYEDNSIIAQMGLPDMRIPIQYALTWPRRLPSPVGELELWKQKNLSFFEPDPDTFQCFSVCVQALKRGGLAPAAANGANEKAVELFLKKRISFLEIGELVSAAVERQPDAPADSLEAVLEADAAAKRFVEEQAR